MDNSAYRWSPQAMHCRPIELDFDGPWPGLGVGVGHVWRSTVANSPDQGAALCDCEPDQTSAIACLAPMTAPVRLFRVVVADVFRRLFHRNRTAEAQCSQVSLTTNADLVAS